MRVWDLLADRKHRKHSTLTGHERQVFSVAITADGKTAVSGGDDGSVRVWDLVSGQQRATLIGHDGRVRAVAVIADGRTAVSGGDDGSVRVWDLVSGQQRATLIGHDGPLLSVAVAEDRNQGSPAAEGTGRCECGT